MSSRKTMIRFFTIADYEEEEIWLREQHKKGWKLMKTILPCFYIFESCAPEDVVYRLDYKNNTEDHDYLQIFHDYGWEYFNRCVGWLYFRKPVSNADTEQDSEIFSDDASRVDMVNHIVKTRMLPLLEVWRAVILLLMCLRLYFLFYCLYIFICLCIADLSCVCSKRNMAITDR